jgi:hypothetical protein
LLFDDVYSSNDIVAVQGMVSEHPVSQDLLGPEILFESPEQNDLLAELERLRKFENKLTGLLI